MRSLRDIGHLYRHGPEVPIVRTDRHLFEPLYDYSFPGLTLSLSRGNHGRDIYADDRDRKLEACAKTGWRIHARLKSDAGHWPAEAERAAGIGATEKAKGAGL